MKKTYTLLSALASPLLMMAMAQPDQPRNQEGIYDEAAGTVTITCELPKFSYDSEYYTYYDLEYISEVILERHTPNTPWPSEPLARIPDQTPGAEFSFVDTDVLPNSKYEYRIICVVDGVKGYSSFVSVYTGIIPDMLTHFSATTTGPEATDVVLTVTAPTVSVSGTPLTTLTAIDIERYQDFTYTTLHTIENVEPGETYTWVHENVNSGSSYYYRARARIGETGWGESIEAQTFVGHDIPGQPAALTVTPSGSTETLISWETPAEGMRGGSFDPDKVIYKITRRLLDGETIEAGETAPGETSFTDRHGYTEETWIEYIVTPYNEIGEGYKTAESEGIIVGDPAKMPFGESFSFGSFDHKGWTRISTQNDPYYSYVAWRSMANSSAYHWGSDEYIKISPQDEDLGFGTCLFYSYSPDGQTESLVSPRIDVSGIENLEFSFYYHDFDAASSGNIVAVSWSANEGEWEEIFRSEPEDDTIPGWNEIKMEFPIGNNNDTIRLRIDAIRGGIPIVDVFVDNIQLKDAGGSSVETIGAADINSNAAAEYFTIDGRKVQTPESGLYIVRKNGKSHKVLVK